MPRIWAVFEPEIFSVFLIVTPGVVVSAEDGVDMLFSPSYEFKVNNFLFIRL